MTKIYFKMKFTCLFDCVNCFYCYFVMFCCNALQSMVTTSHLYTYSIYKAADSRPSIRRREHFDSKICPLKSLHSQKKVVSGVDQMPLFENTEILCRDPNVLVNYSTMKIEIAVMLNLERPITATATASWPRLLYRWNLQGENHLCHSDLCFVVKSVPHQINVLYDFWNISRKFSEFLK